MVSKSERKKERPQKKKKSKSTIYLLCLQGLGHHYKHLQELLQGQYWEEDFQISFEQENRFHPVLLCGSTFPEAL